MQGLLFAGVSSILAADTGFEWGAFAMAEDFSQKYVALVASIIGAVVLLLGLVGLYINLFVG